MKNKRAKKKTMLGKENMVSHLPFIFFLATLTIIYITNVHYSEKKMRQIRHLQSELVEAQYTYKSLYADMNKKYCYTEVVTAAAKLGLKTGDDNLKILEID